MKKKKGVKLEKVQLTQQEIWDSLRVPPPFKSKKNYVRKKKHPKKDLEE